MLGTLIRGRVTVGGSAARPRARGAGHRDAVCVGSAGSSAHPTPTTRWSSWTTSRISAGCFPLIAKSYALQFAQNELVAKLHEICRPPTIPDPEEQRELESRAAGLKAANTWHATQRDPGGARSLRWRRLSRREPADRAEGRHRRVHHVRGRQPRADPAGGQGAADRLRRRHQGHEPRRVGAVRGQLRQRAGAETHCGRDDHADHPRQPGRTTRKRAASSTGAPRSRCSRTARSTCCRRSPRRLPEASARRCRRSRPSTPCRTTCCTPRRRTHRAHHPRGVRCGHRRCSEDDEARKLLGMVCDLVRAVRDRRGQGVVHRAPLPVHRAAPRPSRRGINERRRKLRPHAEVVAVDGFRILGAAALTPRCCTPSTPS